MKKDNNSIKNQEIKGKFVAQHVYCNVNSLVEYCLSKGFEDSESPINFDELENYYSYPEYYGEYAKFDGGTEDQRQTEIDRLTEIWDNEKDTDKHGKIESELQEIRDLESEPQEIYEWWAVSSYLFDKLRDKGYVVIDTGSCHVWGRTTTGQAILLDGVISAICNDMEIMEGQSNEW